jgi:phosphatidylglycerophosphate synthase
MEWPKWLTPNRITFFGFAMAAVYAHACYTRNPFWIITGFGLAELSDFFDGYASRRLNLVTELGRKIDPIRDRLVILIFFYQLYSWGYLQDTPEIVLTAMIFACEFGVWVMRGIAKWRAGMFVRTNGNGKLRQVCHIIMMSLIILILTFGEPTGASPILVGLAIMSFASFYAFVSYTSDALRLMRVARAPKRA